jgi:hypothetical protein
VTASGPKGPSVVEPGVVVVVVGEAEAELETMTDRITGRGIMAGATGEEALVILPILVTKDVLMISFHCSVRVIVPLHHDPVRLRHVAERLPATAPLAQVVLPVGLGLGPGLALPSAHVHAAHLRVVGCHLRQEAHLRHHHVAAGARHRTLRVTKSEIVGLEGGTAAVPQHVGDALVPRHAAVPLVGAQIHPVADAVPAYVAFEGIAHRRATDPRRVEGEGGTGASIEAELVAQRMGGARKGCLVGAEVGLGAQVRMGGARKVRAKDEI